MQNRSYAENVHPRLHIYPSSEADQLKDALLRSTDSPATATTLLLQIGMILLLAMGRSDSLSNNRASRPVFVLRGGLSLWTAARELADVRPSGLLVPLRTQHAQQPRVAYGCVPARDGNRYLLLDMLIASGTTMMACADALAAHTGADDAELAFAAPFVARLGREAIFEKFPQAQVHCIWHNEDIDADGRMVGPGFDVGDFVLGSAQGHVVWSGG
jgi:uracil phosphoribosyltransferase